MSYSIPHIVICQAWTAFTNCFSASCPCCSSPMLCSFLTKQLWDTQPFLVSSRTQYVTWVPFFAFSPLFPKLICRKASQRNRLFLGVVDFLLWIPVGLIPSLTCICQAPNWQIPCRLCPDMGCYTRLPRCGDKLLEFDGPALSPWRL